MYLVMSLVGVLSLIYFSPNNSMGYTPVTCDPDQDKEQKMDGWMDFRVNAQDTKVSNL